MGTTTPTSPLPRYAPIRQAGEMFLSRSLDSGLLIATQPRHDDNNGGRIELSFMAQTLGSREGATPSPMSGSMWSGGLVGASPGHRPSIDAPGLRVAVSDIARGISNLGREVPASTFDSAEGVNALLDSMLTRDVLVQALDGGALVSRVIPGDADLGPLEKTIAHVFG